METPNTNYAICVRNCKILLISEYEIKREINLKSGTLVKILYRNEEQDVIQIYILNNNQLTCSKDIYKCHLSHLTPVNLLLWNYLIAIKEVHNYKRLEIIRNEVFQKFLFRLHIGSRIVISGHIFNRNKNIECVIKYIGPVPEIGLGCFMGFIILNPQDAIPLRAGIASKILKYNPSLCFIRPIDCLLAPSRRDSFEIPNQYMTELRNNNNFGMENISDFRNDVNFMTRSSMSNRPYSNNNNGEMQRSNSSSFQNLANQQNRSTSSSRENLFSQNGNPNARSRSREHYSMHPNQLLDNQFQQPQNQIKSVIPSLMDLNIMDQNSSLETYNNTLKNNESTQQQNPFKDKLIDLDLKIKELKLNLLKETLQKQQHQQNQHHMKNIDLFNSSMTDTNDNFMKMKIIELENKLEEVKSNIHTTNNTVIVNKDKEVYASLGAKPKERKKLFCPLKTCMLNENGIYTNDPPKWNGKPLEFVNRLYKSSCKKCRKKKVNCIFSYKSRELKKYLDILNKGMIDDEMHVAITQKVFLENRKVFYLLKNRKVAKCINCNINLASTQGICLKKCFHIFCKNCLIELIIKNVEGEIKCSAMKTIDEKCLGVMEDDEIQAIVKPDIFKKYLIKKEKMNDKKNNIFHCQNREADCCGFWTIDINHICQLYSCPICEKLNCYSCHAIHTGMSCKKYLSSIENTEGNEENNEFIFQPEQIHLTSDTETSSSFDLESRTSPDQYEQLLALEDADIIENTEEFNCLICYTDCAIGNGIKLRSCLHEFCKICLTDIIKMNEDAVIKCPYSDTEYNCDEVLHEREIKLLVTNEIFEQYLERSLREAHGQIPNSFKCQTPDCKGLWIYDDNIGSYICPLCFMENCHQCRAIHTGKNCREYQDKIFNEKDPTALATKNFLELMLVNGEAMNCPSCDVIIARNEGCDWLICTMCKTEICWVTRGPRWGKGGKGDISGGCKCGGVYGLKCHPDCTYCH